VFNINYMNNPIYLMQTTIAYIIFKTNE